jgi:hypothetical protein
MLPGMPPDELALMPLTEWALVCAVTDVGRRHSVAVWGGEVGSVSGDGPSSIEETDRA